MTGAAARALLAVLALPAVASAQSFGARGLIAGVRSTTATATADLRISGTAFGFEGGAGLGPAALTVRYVEGTMRNDSAALDRAFAEGELTLWARPFQWAAVGGGPHIRSFVATGSTERWLFWEIRARATAGLLPDVLAAYLEGWMAVSGDVDVPEPFDAGRGLEGGLEVSVGRLPVALRLRYRAERIGLGDGVRRETTEYIMLGVGLGRR